MNSAFTNWNKEAIRRFLQGPWPVVCVTALLSSLGMWWSWAETWHPDQMAFMDIFRKGSTPFSPPHFFRPALLTYLNFFVSVAPVKLFEVTLEWMTQEEYRGHFRSVSVWIAKALQVFFASGSSYLLWRIARAAWSPSTALITAGLLATSAGLIVQAHFLTTDVPLVFFLLLAFFLAQRTHAHGGYAAYALAGAAAGLAVAMKYNGGAIVLALPAFHLLVPPAG